MNPTSDEEIAKKLAAVKAVENEFMPLLANTNASGVVVLGIGSGSTIVYAVQYLATAKDRIKATYVCIPTSFQAKQLIIDNGLPLGDFLQYTEMNCTIDGADEFDDDKVCIKGGGGCHTQEKIIAFNSRMLVIIADYRKKSKICKKAIPVEVLPFSYKSVLKHLEANGGTGTLRMGISKAGPCVTDNGNFILDVDFGLLNEPEKTNNVILKIPGVVETGLFVSLAKKIYVGNKDGGVEIIY